MSRLWPEHSPSGFSIPLNPRKEGWHWVADHRNWKPFAAFWCPAPHDAPITWGKWEYPSTHTGIRDDYWYYLGPCVINPEYLEAFEMEKNNHEHR